VGFALRFWWPGSPADTADQGGRYVLLALVVAAIVLALRCPVPSLRRLLVWLLVMAGVMSLLFLLYAQTSIEDIDISQQAYLGYFYWAVPLVVTLVVGAGAAVHLPSWRTAVIALTAVVTAAAVLAAVAPQRQDNPYDPPARYYGVARLPQLVHTLAEAAGSRPIEITIRSGAWFDAAGVAAYADRTGVRTCVGGYQTRRWQYLFRQQSICTASQVRASFHVWFWPPDTKVVPGQVLVARLREALVTRLPSAAR
jgi:hypothetical protein